MNKRVNVTQVSDIAEAVEFVRQSSGSETYEPGKQVSALICEELLLRLLDMGCTKITVSAKHFLSKYTEIRAQGARMDLFSADRETDGAGIDVQINRCLLEQYADNFTYKYRNGVNICRIFPEKKDIPDLTEEIYSFYENADTANEKSRQPYFFICFAVIGGSLSFRYSYFFSGISRR